MTPDEFVKWEASAAGIDFKPEYVDVAKDSLSAGVLLSQIVYWFLPSKKSGKSKVTVQREGRLWIAKSKEVWYLETRLKRDKFDHAADILEDESLIYRRTWHFQRLPTLHIHLRLEMFLPALAEVLARQGEPPFQFLE